MVLRIKCVHCGARSGLTERQSYVGGVGYVWAVECADRTACGTRQDQIAFSDGLAAELEATREQRRVLE